MPNPLQNLKPETTRKMVAELSNAQTLKWVGVALLVHVVIIGATSVNYLRDHVFDAAGAPARAAARAAAIQAAKKPATPATAPTATTPTAPKPAEATKPKTPADEDAALIEKNKTNPVIKSITESAKPADIPKTPTRNGFNFDDDVK
jgi:hypothetical protein